MDFKKFEQNVLQLLNKGRLEEASKHVDNQLKDSDDDCLWSIHNLKGIVFRHKGVFGDAYSAFQTALELANKEHKYIPALNLAVLLNSQNRFREALPLAELAHREKPSANTALVLVSALLDSAKTKRSLEILDTLNESEQKKPEFRLARASCLRHDGRYDEAIALIAEVLKENPQHGTAARMLADITGEVGVNNPLPIYEKALELASSQQKSNLHPIKWNMSLHLLRRRDFKKGLEYYESGMYVGTMGRNIPEPFHRMPRADSKPLDPSLWTYAVVEQGIGDQILFLSCLSDLIEECGSKIVLIAEERMHSILRRSFPSIQLAHPGLIEHLPFSTYPSNGYIPIGSLLRRYRSTLEEFKRNNKPYLIVNKERYLNFRQLLKSEAGDRPVVGLSWKGGFWENQVRNKAIELQQWEPLLRKKAYFVNLQYGSTDEDIQWAASIGVQIRVFPEHDFKRDLDDWLSIACACDGVISVSTALVHFAGAANQKVAVVMPERTGPWYLGINEHRSMVYPNVFHYWKKSNESSNDFLQRVGDIIN
jgi:Flp pilus assembly protein TadD/ADP-heptose:LPS heptosyltransferase